ncbi:MAG: glycosyltransferase family 4 protein [Betaproteobacteria bacterium]|nr:glycosyltransferase family 4 protein [Betaproteobacteria bacterium]
MEKRKICFVVTSPFTLKVFMLKHLEALAGEYAVTVICNASGTTEVALKFNQQIRLIDLRIERKVSPWRDTLALLALLRIFRREGFLVVHTITPKAGLLAQVAACLAGVPHRIHTFTGQVWVTQRGLAKTLLKNIDRFYASCATRILVDSPSQRDFLIEQGVLPKGRGEVLGQGSISGVDMQRFAPNRQVRQEIRTRLGMPDDAVMFLYLGRFKRDKGLLDLARSFATHAWNHPNSWLVVVGPDEEQLSAALLECCATASGRMFLFGYTATPEHYMAAADVLCLPSYREGFGTVILEAAACNLPSIASRIFGITDAVVDGQTGCLHGVGDIEEIVRLLDRFAESKSLRESMGASARQRTLQEFSGERLTSELAAYYRAALASE